MKKKFVFDASENDIIDISEETVIKDTGVNSAAVKENVMKEIKNNKKPVRRIKKKTIISLIAAAAAVAVLGTVSVGASGGFSDTFGEYFAGEPADGVFSGGDVKTESSKVDINFMGITGNDDQVIAMMKLKNKDGSPFVDTTDNVFIDQFDLSYLNNIDNDPADVHIESTLWDDISGQAHYFGGNIIYSFDDESTISAMVVATNNLNGSLKGHRLSVSDKKIYAYTKIKTLYVPKDGDGYSKLVTDDGEPYMQTDGPILEEMTEKYKDTLKDNQIIRFNADDNSVIIAEKTEIELDINVGVTLNYKSTSRNIEGAKGKNYTINNTKWDINYINVNSFTFEFASHTYELPENKEIISQDTEDLSFEKIEEYNRYENSFIPDAFTIKLKDGRTYTTQNRSFGSNGGTTLGDGFGEILVVYEYVDNNGKTAAIDPADIVSITYEGQELM